MKKSIITGIIMFVSFAAKAQENFTFRQNEFPREFVNILAVIFVLYLVVTFLLNVLRSIQEYRLKSKMVEKGVSENVVERFLQPTNRDVKSMAIKWFLILAGIGVGLTVISFSMPLGIHSLAIMAFSLALSFLGYFYFIKQSGNP